MPFLKLFTVPKSILSDLNKFTNAGGKVTFSDSLEIAGRGHNELTAAQESSLIAKHSDKDLIKQDLERVREAKDSDNPRRLERRKSGLKKKLIAYELLEGAQEAGIKITRTDPNEITARQFFRPDEPGLLVSLKDATKRIKDKAREDSILAEERARRTEASKGVVDISKFRKVRDIPEGNDDLDFLSANQRDEVDQDLKDILDFDKDE